MAKNDGKGSILLKLLIVVLAVVLIAVIIIPAQIWKQEINEIKTARDNMTSIYEAERFYHRLNKSFTTDPAELLKVVQQDSTLHQLQEVVNYTNDLAGLMDTYKRIPFIRSLLKINENVDRIREDLENNKRNFRAYEDIKNEAENLKMQVADFNSSDQFSNYVTTGAYLDSLTRLRRDMSDYSLQSCASKAKVISDTLQNMLGQIDVNKLEQKWAPLSKRVGVFIKTVNSSELVNVTSVGDRLKDFKKAVDEGFKTIKKVDRSQNISEAAEINRNTDKKYQAFLLSDFLITSKRALYRLSDADSMVLHLTEDNFYCPVSDEQIKILIPQDSLSIKIESPVLVSEVKNKLAPVVEKVQNLSAMAAFKVYLDTLSGLKEKAYNIRKTIKKNTDIFIAYKEMEEIINRFADISVINAYNDLNSLAERTVSNESYSDLKALTENGLTGIRIFNQAYRDKFFGNLDSLHRDLSVMMMEFDSLLSKVRRLPKSVEKFEMDQPILSQLLENIKNAKDSELENIENNLGEIYLFASEGSVEKKYGVFKKKIKNFGYIAKGTKSWEE